MSQVGLRVNEACNLDDLSGYTQPELDAVADERNNRPRQTLNWKKPTEVFNTFLVEAA